MKIRSILFMLAALIVLSIPVHADLVFQADNKTVEVIGYDIAKDYSDNVLYILLKFTNNSNKTAMPMTCFQVSAYDNGIALQSAFVINGYSGYYGSTTEVRPGATMLYYEAFKEPTSKNVEVEIKKWISFDGKALTFRLDMGGDASEQPEPQKQPELSNNSEKTMNEIIAEQRGEAADGKSSDSDATATNESETTSEQPTETDEQKAIRKLKKRVAKLETRIGELEERITQLENA